MATSTTNLGLTKPSVNDAADIGVLNSNFDKIDAKIPAAGAAPSGYGLGTIAKEITDANTATASGWYSIGAITPSSAHVPFQYVLLEVKAHSNRFIVQHLYRWMTDSPSMRRVYSDGWGEWEYENPPMQLGVEYRTTERWEGKPVYTMLVNCGEMVSGTSVTYAQNVTTIRFAGFAGGVPLPYLGSAGFDGAWSVWMQIKNGTISVYGGSGYANTTINTKAQVWYTKN